MSTIIRTRLLLLRPTVEHQWETNLFAASVHRSASVTVLQSNFCRNHSNWLIKEPTSSVNNVSKFGSINCSSNQNWRLFDQHGSVAQTHRLFSVEKKPVAGDEKSTNVDRNPADGPIEDDVLPEKLGIVAKFKLMYKQYWYVLMPVHLVTSTGWLIGFYYLSKR